VTDVVRELARTVSADPAVLFKAAHVSRAVMLVDSIDPSVRNEADPAARGWIDFELEAAKGNRGAIGAQVRLERETGVTLQELQSASGFCAQNQRRLHFGLGDATAVKRAVITWPGGRQQILENPAINQIHRLKEGAAVGGLR